MDACCQLYKNMKNACVGRLCHVRWLDIQMCVVCWDPRCHGWYSSYNLMQWGAYSPCHGGIKVHAIIIYFILLLVWGGGVSLLSQCLFCCELCEG